MLRVEKRGKEEEGMINLIWSRIPSEPRRRRPEKLRKPRQVKLDMRQMPKTGRHEGSMVVRPNITLGVDGHSSKIIHKKDTNTEILFDKNT